MHELDTSNMLSMNNETNFFMLKPLFFFKTKLLDIITVLRLLQCDISLIYPDNNDFQFNQIKPDVGIIFLSQV